MKLPKINIKPKAKCNGLFITLVCIGLLLLITVVSQFYWQEARFALMFLILASLSGLTLGILKLLEPDISFVLSPKRIAFNHRKGQWQLKWKNILRIKPITNTFGMTQEKTRYIGLTLSSLDQLKHSISLRLANHLIHEQMPLLNYCVSRELIPAEKAVINFEVYTCDDGTEVKGPLAGFFHQSQTLKQALGAHIFINDSYIDRDLEEFSVLLKECKQASTNYLDE